MYYHSWLLDASSRGVYLTKGQPDPKIWQKCQPDPKSHLWGVHLTKGQPYPKADQMSSWPEVVPLLATRCLYQGLGYVWWKVSLTQRSEKMSTWPKVSSRGSICLKCKKDIWKIEHTLRFMVCFAEVFSTKDQQETNYKWQESCYYFNISRIDRLYILLSSFV